MAYQWLIWDTFNRIGRDAPKVSDQSFPYDWFTVSIKIDSLTEADINFMEATGCPRQWIEMIQEVVDYAFRITDPKAPLLPKMCYEKQQFRQQNPQVDEILIKFACTAKWLRGYAENLRDTYPY